MNAGLDFGTSNSLIGVWDGNGPVLVDLEKGKKNLPSILYAYGNEIEIEDISEVDLNERVKSLKSQQAASARQAKNDGANFKLLTDDELFKLAMRSLRRETFERSKLMYNDRSVFQAIEESSKFLFGEEALKAHIEQPHSGFLVKSPKSFIGAEIKVQHKNLFLSVITKIMRHIKETAESSVRTSISNVVVGRPVTFHGQTGDKGNYQAIEILRRAALSAGFSNVEFLMEPIAAALDFERTLTKDCLALVLDAGGGTTDCSMIKLGPSYSHLQDRKKSVLSCSGARIGGTDLDINLALKKIMPHFGRNSLLSDGLPIPNSLFSRAIAINDVSAQLSFLSEATEREIIGYLGRSRERSKLQRLLKLQRQRLTARLNRSAELAKIYLSERNQITLPLHYIENDLNIQISQNDLKDAIGYELEKMCKLLMEAEKQSGAKPDVIYVTGGTAKSPLIREFIKSYYSRVEIVIGDEFGSVASGLTAWANKIYS
jgi:hypothetical chaperone protein